MQTLAALYRLGRRVEVAAGEGMHRQTKTVGLGHLDCATCDEHDERGCTLPGRERPPIDDAHRIDNTGDRARDFIRCCPAGLRVREPLLAQALDDAPLIEACGGPQGYYEERPATLPPRIAWFYTAYRDAASRFEAACVRAQSRVSRAAMESETSALAARRRGAA